MSVEKREYKVLRPINAYGEYQRKGTIVSLTDDAAAQVADRIEAVNPVAATPAATEAPEAPQAPVAAPAEPEANAVPPVAPEAPVGDAPAAEGQPLKEDLNDL
jgi:hypothetical protein